MELNIKKAFCSPFSDEKWYIKLIFPSVMAVFSLLSQIAAHQHNHIVLIILMLITLIPGFVLWGFFAQFAHNEIHDQQPLLPDLKSNVNQYFKYGLKYLALILIYAIIFFIICIVLGVVLGVSMGFASAIFNFGKMTNLIVTTIVLVPVSMFIFAFFVFVQGMFVDNFDFEEALNYKKILNLLAEVHSEIIVYILLAAGLVITLAILILLLSLPRFTLIFAPIVLALEQFISINLKAQVYKIAKSRLDNTQQ